jgi:hypothetical protein
MPGVDGVSVDLSNGRRAGLQPSPTSRERLFIRISSNAAAVPGSPGSTEYTNGAWNPYSPVARSRLEQDAGLAVGEASTLQQAYDAWIASQRAQQAAQVAAQPAAAAAATGPTLDVVQRLLHQPVAQGTFIPGLTASSVIALMSRPGMSPDTVIEWTAAQGDIACVLDVDFHDAAAPKPRTQDLDQLGDELNPAPAMWWISHGGGLKALYLAIPRSCFTARELAAGAAAQVSCDPTVVASRGTVELLTHTRHPTSLRKGKACGRIHTPGQTEHFACLHRFSHADATERDIEEACEELNYTIGDRLTHDQCLIDPGHVSQSPNPVLVTETGLYCFSCAGRGDPGKGFRSWGAVRRMNGLPASQDAGGLPIMLAAQHFVHAEHASLLLGALAPEIPTAYRRPLYSALLKTVHGMDPRVPLAFTSFGFVRGEDSWLHTQTLKTSQPLSKESVSVLPSVRVLNTEPDADPTMVSTALTTLHINNGRLPGWMPITPNRFVPIFSIHNELPSSSMRAICTPDLVVDGRPHVVYCPANRRLSKAEAIQRITTYFPGVSVPYLTAIIVAMGCAESSEGMPPMLWASGKTGAAKTMTTRIITEMFGENYENISTAREDRLGQMFGEALEDSRVILFDDVAKNPKEYPMWHTFFLKINRRHSFHKLYIGKTNVLVSSAIIITDRETPSWFRNSPQFGRRCHHVRLEALPRRWDQDLGHMVERWWQRTPELTEAAESFYSWVVDEYFPAGDGEGFGAKMKRLGIPLFLEERSGETDDANTALSEVVARLVIGICEAGPLSDNDERRFGRGYREVVFGGQSVIGKAATELIEDQGPVMQDKEHLEVALDQFQADLKQRLGLIEPARLEVRECGRKTYIRLIQDGIAIHNRMKLVNRELFPVWPPDQSRFRHGPLDGAQVNGHHHPSMNGHALAPPVMAASVAEIMAGTAPPVSSLPAAPLPTAWAKLFSGDVPRLPDGRR